MQQLAHSPSPRGPKEPPRGAALPCCKNLSQPAAPGFTPSSHSWSLPPVLLIGRHMLRAASSPLSRPLKVPKMEPLVDASLELGRHPAVPTFLVQEEVLEPAVAAIQVCLQLAWPGSQSSSTGCPRVSPEHCVLLGS